MSWVILIPPWSLKQNFHFDKMFVSSCTRSCHFYNFQCKQWRKFWQNDNIAVSVIVFWFTDTATIWSIFARLPYRSLKSNFNSTPLIAPEITRWILTLLVDILTINALKYFQATWETFLHIISQNWNDSWNPSARNRYLGALLPTWFYFNPIKDK